MTIHIPGHTPGSMAIIINMEKRVLFGQDIHGPYDPAWGAEPVRARTPLQKLIDLDSMRISYMMGTSGFTSLPWKCGSISGVTLMS